MVTLREEHMRRTRAALLAAGRSLFGSRGFTGASVDDLANAARVTTGALYHHFDNKTELFAAVFEAVHQDVLERNASAAEGADNELGSLILAFSDFLDAMLDAEVRQIMITDAPSVLGLQRFTELDEQYAFAAIVDTLERAATMGELEVADPEVLAHLLLGALMRGAVLIANSDHPQRTSAAVSATIEALLVGLTR